MQALVPAVQQLIDDDLAAGRPQDHRLRVGMYAYTTGAGEPGSPGEEDGHA